MPPGEAPAESCPADVSAGDACFGDDAASTTAADEVWGPDVFDPETDATAAVCSACTGVGAGTPGSLTVCPGTYRTFTALPSGGDGWFGYRWFEWNCTGTCSWKWVGTDSKYFTTNRPRSYYVRCSSCGSSANSGIFSLANYPAPTTSTPASATVCPGTYRTFTVTPGGGNGSYGYQWYEWNCNGSCSWKLVSTSSSYTTNLVRTYYVRVTSCGGAQAVNSNQFTLANYSAVATTTPATATVPPGTYYTFTLTASGGNGSYGYQWYEWNCNGGCSWKAVGTNSRSYTTNLVRSYYVRVTSCGGVQSVNTGIFELRNSTPTLGEREGPGRVPGR